MKTSIKYYLKTSYKAIGIFYIAIIAATIFFVSMNVSDGVSEGNSTFGLSGTTIVFLFVLGLNSFKSTFLHFLSMCQTRKNLFIGFAVSSLIIACAMTCIDTLVAVIGNMLPGNVLISISLSSGSAQISINAILSLICMYSFALFTGYFITVAYYRMNKVLKWVVSVGVPVLLFIVWPYVDTVYLYGKLTSGVLNLLGSTLFSPNLPVSMLSFIAVSCAMLGFSYLGIRKAAIKQ